MSDENTEVQIEIEDDTPAEDRGRTPIKNPDVSDDEIAKYSDDVQQRIKHLKHGYHDERRAKEAALREKEEAIAYAAKIADENKKLQERVSNGENTLIKTLQTASDSELGVAKREYKEALETGDSEKIVEAQEKLHRIVMRHERLKTFKPQLELTKQEKPVYTPPVEPARDRKAESWKKENPWFGDVENELHEEMTAVAVAVHNKLTREYGNEYAKTDEYYRKINDRVRLKFPEYFGEQDDAEEPPRKRPASVVAPVQRSSPPKQIKLRKSQLEVAKRLGIKPELYYQHMLELEQKNG
jgi:hypothetical protein